MPTSTRWRTASWPPPRRCGRTVGGGPIPRRPTNRSGAGSCGRSSPTAGRSPAASRRRRRKQGRTYGVVGGDCCEFIGAVSPQPALSPRRGEGWGEGVPAHYIKHIRLPGAAAVHPAAPARPTLPVRLRGHRVDQLATHEVDRRLVVELDVVERGGED